MDLLFQKNRESTAKGTIGNTKNHIDCRKKIKIQNNA